MVEALVGKFSKDFCFVNKHFLLLLEHLIVNLILAFFLSVKITGIVHLRERKVCQEAHTESSF